MNASQLGILSAIHQAGPNPHYVTQQDGQELVAAGCIVVNPNDRSPTNFNAFRAMITTAGMIALQSQRNHTIYIQSDVPIPVTKEKKEKSKESKRSPYPFEQMEVGQSFHVCCTAEVPEPWKKMASSVSQANARFEVEVVPKLIISKVVKSFVKNQDGSFTRDGNGKKVFQEVTIQVPKTVPGKLFKAAKRDSTDPCGSGCRVWRIA